MDFDLREISSPFDQLIGSRVVSDDPDGAVLKLSIRDDLKQPMGIVHGGVFSTLIEGLCSRATAIAVFPDGNVAMGQSIGVSFLRPASEGEIEVRAVARHRGRTSWVWECEVVDDQGRLCALGQMTIAVRPIPPGATPPA